MTRPRKRLAGVLAAAMVAVTTSVTVQETAEPTRFAHPCADYAKGLRGKGDFGKKVPGKGSPFSGTWHLAEDVWLPAGTEVRSIADGVVRYSDFSPTWTDEQGQVHWNLGNVIVVEHRLEPPDGDLAALCSVYVHLADDRRVEVGERVSLGQVLGRIGADRSEENGRYPAHLHFGLHRGPYIQISPSYERELREAAAAPGGLRFGDVVIEGEIELRLVNETSVLVASKATGQNALLSLLCGSTAQEDPPEDIACWCQGYGDRKMLEDWIRPSTFLAERTGR